MVSGSHPQLQTQTQKRLPTTPVATDIPYGDAEPILASLRESLPAALISKAPADLSFAWPDWVLRRKNETRERLDRGDEDSIVNFWYYGYSFTKLPPLSTRSIRAIGADARSVERFTSGRLEDLIAGMASPGTNERLQFARTVIKRRVPDPTTSRGKAEVRRYFFDLRRRVLAERDERSRSLGSTTPLDNQNGGQLSSFTQFRDRGLSSDTSFLSSFTIERALAVFKSGDAPTIRGIRRVAIVGPGLDFIDKNDGFDFYPVQTIQPFAVVDSLIRLGLSKADDLGLTALELSPRIIRHIESAGQRARAGDP